VGCVSRRRVIHRRCCDGATLLMVPIAPVAVYHFVYKNL
jgi:hypothetical protein